MIYIFKNHNKLFFVFLQMSQNQQALQISVIYDCLEYAFDVTIYLFRSIGHTDVYDRLNIPRQYIDRSTKFNVCNDKVKEKFTSI